MMARAGLNTPEASARVSPNVAPIYQKTDSPETRAFIEQYMANPPRLRQPSLQELAEDPAAGRKYIAGSGLAELGEHTPQARAIRQGQVVNAPQTLEKLSKARLEEAEAAAKFSKPGQQAALLGTLIKQQVDPVQAQALVNQMGQSGVLQDIPYQPALKAQPDRTPPYTVPGAAVAPPTKGAAPEKPYVPRLPEWKKYAPELDSYLPKDIKTPGYSNLGSFLTKAQQGGTDLRALLDRGVLQPYIEDKFGSDAAEKAMGKGSRLKQAAMMRGQSPTGADYWFTGPGMNLRAGDALRRAMLGKTDEEQALENLWNYTAQGVR
jgi:hypothetical protein